ncbi:DUF4385 domain-containing protein [bacterium]|nr:MAG: DUF4385 domain-containing protein [bacterium]
MPSPYDDPEIRATDFRAHPERYRVARGEQGVLIVQPYKGELLPHWRFRTPEIATESSRLLTEAFARYRDADDFVGMDMARKFLQMGYTRARRYANHASGRKRDEDGTVRPQDPGSETSAKAASARIFKAAWDAAEADPVYAERKATWKRERG